MVMHGHSQEQVDRVAVKASTDALLEDLAEDKEEKEDEDDDEEE